MSLSFKKKSGFAGLLGIISAIVLLALAFHYPVRIIDALSSEQVSDFDINISFWRIIFEPFIGTLLFYLRADQPLLEFLILVIWIISLSLILTFSGILFNKNFRGFKAYLSGFLSWLIKVPLIFSIWLGLLFLIIFMTLPANTIVNNLQNTILINTHSHTEYSHDGIISQADLQKWHKRNGFDAFFITDHNHHKKTLEAVRAQEAGTLPQKPLIICGEEFSGSNHMTLLGLNRNFTTRGLSDQQVIDSTHDDNGIVIVAHWFDGERKSIPYFIDLGVDGFEIANQAAGLNYDRRIFNNIVKACTSNGLVMNGAVDYHGYGSTCFVWNALEIPDWHRMDDAHKRESILDVLRQKDMSKIRILLYDDRNIFDRSLVLLSPVFTLISYCKTLNLLQVLSWVIWLIIIFKSGSKLRNTEGNRWSLQILEILALMSSLYILAHGIILLNKARFLSEYNDIYSEYGTIMLLCGAGFLIYTIILILFEFKRKPSIKSQI